MRRWLLAVLFAAAASPALAGGVAGAGLMGVRLSARATALGETYAALGDDVQALLYNPAGILNVRGPSLDFLHWAAVAGVAYENLAYAQPFFFGTMGLDVTLRSQPDINNPLATDNPVSANDVMVALSYAQKPSYFLPELPENIQNLVVGVNLKYLRSHLGAHDANGYALDLGARKQIEDGLVGGISLLNLGPPITFVDQGDPLPTTLLAGLAKTLHFGSANTFHATADLDYGTVEGAMSLHAGLEDWLGKALALRVGYIVAGSQDLGGLTAGFSIRLDQDSLLFGFDYAFRPLYYNGFSSFEPQHLFGMDIAF